MRLFVPLCHSFLFTMKLMFYFSLLNGHICRTHNLPYFALIIMLDLVFLRTLCNQLIFFHRASGETKNGCQWKRQQTSTFVYF